MTTPEHVEALYHATLETAVYVGKTEGLSLVHRTASPMLSKEEAPWVASEMRRGLRNWPVRR